MNKTLTQLQIEAKDALDSLKYRNKALYLVYSAKLPLICLSKKALQNFIDDCNNH